MTRSAKLPPVSRALWNALHCTQDSVAFWRQWRANGMDDVRFARAVNAALSNSGIGGGQCGRSKNLTVWLANPPRLWVAVPFSRLFMGLDPRWADRPASLEGEALLKLAREIVCVPFEEICKT